MIDKYIHRYAPLRRKEDCTYGAKRPEGPGVYDQPRLFAEASHFLLLAQTHVFAERGQEVLHTSGAKASQEDDHEKHIVHIVEANAILVCSVVVVLQSKELGGVGLRFGKEVVCAKQKGKEVEGEAYRINQSSLACDLPSGW